MADIDLQGRKEIPEVLGNPNPVKTTNVEKKPVEPELKEASNLVQLIPSKEGNEMVVLVQLISSINRNLAFLASTIHKHLNPEEKKNG